MSEVPVFDLHDPLNEGFHLLFLSIDHMPAQTDFPTLNTDPTHPTVQIILDSFSIVFSPPHGLSPSSLTNNEIMLCPGAGPIKVRPYRYPHSHKTEISNLVE